MNNFTIILQFSIILLVVKTRAVNFTKLANVSYGTNKEQIMDIHFPNPSGNLTKIVLLLHGGAWASGSKNDMDFLIPNLIKEFPTYLIANLNYRLGTWFDPGNPKQLEDIETAIKFLKINRSIANPKIALIGENSGGHLALLYAYKSNTNSSLKTISVIGNIGGPVDFTDVNYRTSLQHNLILFSFIGPKLYVLHPNLYKEISPVTYVNSTSPPTISFFGANDPTVPDSQKTILQKALDKVKVPNEEYSFSGGQFSAWPEIDKDYLTDRLVHFLGTYF